MKSSLPSIKDAQKATRINLPKSTFKSMSDTQKKLLVSFIHDMAGSFPYESTNAHQLAGPIMSDMARYAPGFAGMPVQVAKAFADGHSMMGALYEAKTMRRWGLVFNALKINLGRLLK